MPITRLGNVAQNNLQLFQIRTAQLRLADLETQIVSGKKSQNYSGISRDVPALLAAENELARIKRYEQNIVTAETRLELSEANTAGMQDITEQMKQITNIIPVDYDLVAEQAQNFLSLFGDLMNAQDSTRYLFGGTNTGSPPVTIYLPGTGPAPDPANPTGQTIFGSPNADAANSTAGYRFQINATGLDTDTQIQINQSLNVTVQYTATNNTVPATANSTNAFQEALIGLVSLADQSNTAIYPAPTQTDTETARNRLNNALNGVSGSYKSFSEMRTSLSTTNKTIDSVKNTFYNVKNISENTIIRVEDVDNTEAAIRLQENMVQLEATYSAVQQISRLTLLDYL
ncbi:MAG: flagellin [Sneathiellaceae bacterium]